MDTTRRNNLLYYRDLKAGTLDLASAEPGAIERLFQGEKVGLRSLVPPAADPRAGAKLREIVRRAQSNLEEKGLQTLFLAYGMTTWPVDDDGRPPEAAIVLLPVLVEGRRSDPDSMTIQNAGLPQPNIALLHSLAEHHRLTLSEDDLIDAGSQDEQEFDPELVLQYLREATTRVFGLEISARKVLGNFSFQKLAMVKDLRENADLLEAHDMVAALAGDAEARNALGGRHASIEPEALDTVPAENEFMVLDADSSQQTVVHSVASDLDGIIQGPPGCGKSQTIANVIATLVARGKRVLFVAEKRAALEAVYKRLEEKGLGHLALDLHGAAVSQKTVMVKVASTLEKIRRAVDPDDDELHRRFEDRRARVVAHDRAMHEPRAPSGLSAYEMQTGIVETAKVAASKTRWRGPDLAKLDNQACTQALDLLAEAQGVASLLSRTEPSPWTNAALTDGSQVQLALDSAQSLADTDLPEFDRSLRSLAEAASFTLPKSLAEARQALAVAVETNDLLDAWGPAVLEGRAPADDLAPAARGRLPVLWATLTHKKFRAARRLMADQSKQGTKDPGKLLQAACKANELADRWAALSTQPSGPRRVGLAEDVAAALGHVEARLLVLEKAVAGLRSLPLEGLREVVGKLASDQAIAHTVPSVRRIEAQLWEIGAGAILTELRTDSVPRNRWADLFRHAYYASCYDAARVATPDLAAFHGESHSRFAEEFRELDRERLSIAAARVRRAHAELAIAAMNEDPEQTLLVRAEAAKRTRHLPLRRLVRQAADVLTAVCPCWMSSPLNVSQLLPADREYFDVVVFDEASQVPTEDSVCSIVRGKRLVVAGDPHQLPPTIFFADGSDDGEPDAPTSGYESLLDAMNAFVDHWPLDWHYRSRDERLIAFSNRHIYGNRLTTFPGIGGPPTISHVLVDAVPRDGEEESSTAEVEQVVELVIAHADAQIRAHETDWESLGVIAMGIKHANRVQAALDRALEDRRDLDRFFDPTREERFFVKNLEQVQGDERDAIILSVGYAKSRGGRLLYRFGPILQQGGERRLNVAVTRAKRRMTLVSSFSHADMDPRRSENSKGVEFLRLYLQFAATEGMNLGDPGGTGEAMNAFESDIHDALAGRGIPLIPQYGASGYRLDFAALHPKREGEFVLAIECDGASYHHTATARDRDRLRQQQLETIGWRFHRIWSTDWFLRREEQIASAVKAWEDSVQAADRRREHEDEKTFRLGGLFALPDPEPPSPPPSPAAPRSAQRTGGPPEVHYDTELPRLVKWICSDGLLRTDDEIIDEALRVLGYKRRGHKIVRWLKLAIGEAKS